MASAPFDLLSLRRGCAQCSLQQLCLPAGVGRDELQQLDDIVKRKQSKQGLLFGFMLIMVCVVLIIVSQVWSVQFMNYQIPMLS